MELAVDLGPALARENIQPFLVMLMAVINKTLLARRHPRQRNRRPLEPGDGRELNDVNIRMWIPRVLDMPARYCCDLGGGE
jgi:hypothetical protein